MSGRPGAHSICKRSGKRSWSPVQPIPLCPLSLPKGHPVTCLHQSVTSVPGHYFWDFLPAKAYPNHSASSCLRPQVPHPGGHVAPACLLRQHPSPRQSSQMASATYVNSSLLPKGQEWHPLCLQTPSTLAGALGTCQRVDPADGTAPLRTLAILKTLEVAVVLSSLNFL